MALARFESTELLFFVRFNLTPYEKLENALHMNEVLFLKVSIV